MGRWRAPQPGHARYITAAGFAALDREVRELWERRREVVKHLAAAAAEGDRSENAEYQYRKKELRGIDRRIAYLQRRMPSLTVVSAVPDDASKVYFGASVEIEDEQGKRETFRIVGADEARAESGLISMDAPVGRTLLGRSLDDEVTLEQRGEQRRAWIVSIHYPDPCESSG